MWNRPLCSQNSFNNVNIFLLRCLTFTAICCFLVPNKFVDEPVVVTIVGNKTMDGPRKAGNVHNRIMGIFKYALRETERLIEIGFFSPPHFHTWPLALLKCIRGPSTTRISSRLWLWWSYLNSWRPLRSAPVESTSHATYTNNESTHN